VKFVAIAHYNEYFLHEVNNNRKRSAEFGYFRCWVARRFLPTLSMPSFEDFPIEIALRIIGTAIRLLVIRDRQSAFQIAMVCRATFTAAAPHLYRSLAIRWHPHNGPDSQSPEIFTDVLKHVRHLYISDRRLDESWAIQLLAAWWPPAGTEAFIDAPLPQIRKALEQIESHRYSGVTGLRIVYGDFGSVFLDQHPLPAEWSMRLTHLIAFFPLLRGVKNNEESWVERLFLALPSLGQVGFKVTNYQLNGGGETVFFPVLEAIVRRFLVQKAVKNDCDALQLSRLCVHVTANIHTEMFRPNLQSLVSRIDDNRFTIWIDERPPLVQHINHVVYDDLDRNQDAVDARARWDFWTPEDRPEAVLYRVGH